MPSRGGAGLGADLPVAVKHHLAAGGVPDEAERLHVEGDVGGGDEGSEGAEDAVHHHLHAALIRAHGQRHAAGGVRVGEEPLFLMEEQR